MMSGAQIVSHRRINQLRLPFAEGLWQVMDLYVTGQGKSKLNGSYMSTFAAEGKESEGRVTMRTEWLSWASLKRWAWWRDSSGQEEGRFF